MTEPAAARTDERPEADRRGRVIVVTESGQAVGFRLAGVGTVAADGAGDAAAVVERLLDGASPPAVIAVHEPFLDGLDGAVRRRFDALTYPLVIALPGGGPLQTETRQSRLARMLWEAVGYEITFEEGARS